MKTSPIQLFLLLVSMTGCKPHDDAATVPKSRTFTAEQLYADFRLIPGTLATSRPSTDEARAVLNQKDLATTNEIVPREWPDDSGFVRFIYEPNGERYWAYRVNGMNPGESEWLVGPFRLPRGE